MIDPRTLGAIYLASPYSDPDETVRNRRYLAAKAATVQLVSAGAWVYSPIAMLGDRDDCLPKTWEFWEPVSIGMLLRMDSLVVLTLDGWRESVGVSAEIAECLRQPLVQTPPGLYPHPYYMCPDLGAITTRPIHQ